jgi:transcriptional regulator with XRE-family HTH domain
MDEFKKCSQFIKDFRKERNLTQEDLAEVLQYSQKSVAKWEQCVSLPPMDVLVKLRELSGKTIDEILGLKDAELKKEDLINEFKKDKTNFLRDYIDGKDVLDIYDIEDIYKLEANFDVSNLLEGEIIGFFLMPSVKFFVKDVSYNKIQIQKLKQPFLDFFIRKGLVSIEFVKINEEQLERRFYATKEFTLMVLNCIEENLNFFIEKYKEQEGFKDIIKDLENELILVDATRKQVNKI